MRWTEGKATRGGDEGGAMGQEPNTPKIDRGRSILNATDENANPYGLVLSENERGFIYAGLNRLDNRTNAILNGKNGWKQQAQATVSAIVECSVGLFIASVLSHFLNISVLSATVVVPALIVLQKLYMLLTNTQ